MTDKCTPPERIWLRPDGTWQQVNYTSRRMFDVEYARVTSQQPLVLWRISEHGIFRGTLRIGRFDFDTNPAPEFKQEIYAEMLTALTRANQPVPNEIEAALAELREMFPGDQSEIALSTHGAIAIIVWKRQSFEQRYVAENCITLAETMAKIREWKELND